MTSFRTEAVLGVRAIETVAESGRGAGARRPLHSQRDAGATKESSSNVSLGGNSALALLARRTKPSVPTQASGKSGWRSRTGGGAGGGSGGELLRVVRALGEHQ